MATPEARFAPLGLEDLEVIRGYRLELNLPRLGLQMLAFLRRRTSARANAGGVAGAESAKPRPPHPSLRVSEDALAELCLALFNANEFVYVD